jgi:hypothetical protein
MRRAMLTTWCALLVAGCATESAFREKAESHLGQDVNDLLSEMGPPSREYTMPSGHKLLTWIGVGSTVAVANTSGATTVASAKTHSCSLTYEIGDDRVVSYRYDGRCRSH